jgi:hypothetical protein
LVAWLINVEKQALGNNQKKVTYPSAVNRLREQENVAQDTKNKIVLDDEQGIINVGRLDEQ